MSKEIKQAIVLVDAYRRPDRQRNTAGRYRVGAKTEKEAEELVRKAIGFGSVKFYYWEDKARHGKKVAYKEIVLDNTFEKPTHACDRRKSDERDCR